MKALQDKRFQWGFRRQASGTYHLILNRCKAKMLERLSVSGNTQRTITIDGTEYVVPDDYTQLEYIESTGTQYIDTGIAPASNFDVSIKFATTNNSNVMVTGSGSGDSDLVTFVQTRTNSIIRYIVGNYPDKSKDISFTYSTGNPVLYRLYNDGTSQTAYINGSSVATSSYTANGNSTNMILFARKFGTAINAYFTGKIYSFKWTNDGVLVANFIPAKRNSDNAIGMYDFVTGTFFTNQGTGVFTAGPELPLPSGGEATSNLYDGTTNYFPITSDMVGQTISWKLFDETNFARSAIAATESGVETYIGTTVGDSHTITTYDATNGHLWIEKANKVAFSASELVTQKFMVVLGSTVPTIYEPYGTKAQPLGVAGVGDKTENLFDKSVAPTNEGWYPDTDVIANAPHDNATSVIPCKPNTTYSCWHTKYYGAVRLFSTSVDNPTIGSAITVAAGDYNRPPLTVQQITTGANDKWLFVNYGRVNLSGSPTFEQQASDFVLAEGTVTSVTADDYIPYGYKLPILIADNSQMTGAETHTAYLNSPLLKVGDYADEVDVISGKVIRRIGVFNGSQITSVSLRSDFSTTGSFYVGYGQLPVLIRKGALNEIQVLCNAYKSLPTVIRSSQPDKTVMVENNYETVNFRDTDLIGKTTDEILATLADMTFWVVRKTEVEETITPLEIKPSVGDNYIEVQTEVKLSASIAQYRSQKNA